MYFRGCGLPPVEYLAGICTVLVTEPSLTNLPSDRGKLYPLAVLFPYSLVSQNLSTAALHRL